MIDENLDKKNGLSNTHIKCRNKILNIIKNYNLIDIWRISNPQKRKYTWNSNTKPPIFCRLDYFLVTDTFRNLINKSTIQQGYKTDHSLISLNINFSIQKRGPGYFKLNNSLILDDNYNTNIIKCINDTVNSNRLAKPEILWELIKGNIRNYTIKFASSKRKKEKEYEENLQNEINTLENLIPKSQNREEYTEKLLEKKNEMQTYYDKKINGIMIRSKAIQIEMNEKTKTTNIPKLIINNHIITHTKEILNESTNFYRKLYQIKPPEETEELDFFDSYTNKL